MQLVNEDLAFSKPLNHDGNAAAARHSATSCCYRGEEGAERRSVTHLEKSVYATNPLIFSDTAIKYATIKVDKSGEKRQPPGARGSLVKLGERMTRGAFSLRPPSDKQQQP